MTTRRDFITITVLGATAAAFDPSRVHAAPKSMTVARESSFIKPFDDYFSQKLAAEYEKQTGVQGGELEIAHDEPSGPYV